MHGTKTTLWRLHHRRLWPRRFLMFSSATIICWDPRTHRWSVMGPKRAVVVGRDRACREQGPGFVDNFFSMAIWRTARPKKARCCTQSFTDEPAEFITRGLQMVDKTSTCAKGKLSRAVGGGGGTRRGRRSRRQQRTKPAPPLDHCGACSELLAKLKGETR